MLRSRRKPRQLRKVYGVRFPRLVLADAQHMKVQPREMAHRHGNVQVERKAGQALVAVAADRRSGAEESGKRTRPRRNAKLPWKLHGKVIPSSNLVAEAGHRSRESGSVIGLPAAAEIESFRGSGANELDDEIIATRRLGCMRGILDQ